ncbi:PHD finger protein 10 [Paragonimus heterotremus]|uniref:PHD finger protein 10 n=1 Tax=Paragonimus heterotremus TaxID=100268 RepID=A0A8J4TRT6_9TREM|nr:PHD finger protein 10 [Paragonimus heterotremus]
MDRLDSDFLLSDMENSMDTLPDTPLTKCVEIDLDTNSGQGDSQTGVVNSLTVNRRDSRIKPETMLSRVGSFASLTDAVSIDDIFEYDWADSDSESPNEKHKESYMVQELLADYLKIKSFKRKYPDLARRTMDAYERSWLQQESLVPIGRADLGLTALRTDDVMRLLQSDYPEVHSALSDLFRRRRFQKAVELQKRQYEAARIERGEARAEAARRRALDSAADFNHQLITERFNNRRCYWDLQTMQIHFPQRCYKLLEPRPHPHGAYPVAVIPGQFAEHFEVYTPEQLMHLPLSHCLYSQPTRRHREPPPLPTNLRFGSLQPRAVTSVEIGVATANQKAVEVNSNDQKNRVACDERPHADISFKEARKDESHDNRPVTSTERPNDSSTSCSPAEADRDSDTPSRNLVKPGDSDSAHCVICKREAQVFIRCSECGQTGHPTCLDISDAMLPSVKSYQWSCMECKRCVECLDSGNEEQMMFCDRCDRGYHVFCVGLGRIPDGRWECPLCTGKPISSRVKRSRTSRSYQPRSSRTPKNPRKPRKGFVGIAKNSDGVEVKPKRIPRKKKLASPNDGMKVDAVSSEKPHLNPSSSVDPDQSSSEIPVKRKRGRPRLTDVRLTSPTTKRSYKPRSPRKTKVDPSSSSPPVTQSASPSVIHPFASEEEGNKVNSNDEHCETVESQSDGPDRVESPFKISQEPTEKLSDTVLLPNSVIDAPKEEALGNTAERASD